jgi:hypothetical protein
MKINEETEMYLAELKVMVDLFTRKRLVEAREKLKRANKISRLAGVGDDIRDKCALLLEAMSDYANGIPPARLEDIANDFYDLVYLLPIDSKRRLLDHLRTE